MSLPIRLDNRAADFRYALRMIRKTPAASAMAVLSLALGIGANTAIFSLVDTVLLKWLPVRSPQELFLLAVNPGEPRVSWNYPDYVAFRDHNHSFTGLAGASSGALPLGMELVGGAAGGPTELVYASIVSGNYFEVLGVQPAIGRLLNPEDDRKPGAAPYVVLSFDYWRARFQGDPRVMGRGLRLNGYPFTIVGVARSGFHGTDVTASPNLFLPIMMRSEITGVPLARWNTRHHWWMQVIGRLKPGANLRQAETELYAIYRGQEEGERRTAPDPRYVNRAQPVVLLPAARGYSYVRNRLEEPLLVLMVVVGLVLLIACANVANLMLARGAARQREIAVRLAVGASRSRLTAQLLTESIVLALAGGVAGFAVSWLGVRGLLQFVPQSGWSQVTLKVAPDARLLGFTTVISLLTGALFGLAPALQSTRPRLVSALKDETPGAGSSRVTLRNALVVVQVALSLMLLIGAGLFVRSLDHLRDIDPGFRRDHTVIAFIEPDRNGYKGQRLRDFYGRLLAAVETLPGVQSASLAEITPLGGSQWNGDISVEGYVFKPSDPKYVYMNAVGPRYFETLGIPILMGRDFRDQDNPAVSEDPPQAPPGRGPRPEPPGPRLAIINESMARHFFAGRNPIGLHLCRDEKYDAARAYEIVGVVKDVHYFGLREALEPMIYFPVWRPGADSRALCIRTSREAAGVIEAVRRQVSALDPAVPVLNTRTIEQQIDNNLLVERLMTTLSCFFGGLALLLAAVGLYGVISYAVTRRTHEIGIRMALGAERRAVLWLIARHAAGLVLLGAAIGIPAALALTRLVKSFLYSVSAQDPVAIVLGTVTLAAVSALASLTPARRATRVDPMVALRHE